MAFTLAQNYWHRNTQRLYCAYHRAQFPICKSVLIHMQSKVYSRLMSIASTRTCQSCFSVESQRNHNLRMQRCQFLRQSFHLRQYHATHFLREYRAFNNMLKRSGFTVGTAIRWLSTSQCCSQKENNNKDKDQKKDDDPDKNQVLIKLALWCFLMYIAMSAVSLLLPHTDNPDTMRYISWNEFLYHMLAKGEVEQLVIRPELNLVIVVLQDGAVVKGKRVEHKTFHMNVIDTDRFEERLRHAERELGVPPNLGIPIRYERNQEGQWLLVLSLVGIAVLIIMMYRSGQIKVSLEGMDSFTRLGKAKFTIVDPLVGGSKGVRFKDVAGMKEAKQEVLEFVDYLKKPQVFKELGAKPPHGALLLGPPGCGKTLLAKAVASEASVPFLAMAGSEFVEMIGGLGAARVRDLFKEARKRAPCIVYIDEIDAIGRRRAGGASGAEGMTGEEEQTLNQLLVEMDGMSTKEGVVVLASTNRSQVLDKALLRPGRFDRHILIDLPTLLERKEIFEYYLKQLKLVELPTHYSKRLAQLTPGFSGADIANICNEAAIHAATVGKKDIDDSDFEFAVERVIAGTVKKSTVLSAIEKNIVAYHESGHALVGWLLEHTDSLLKVTIVPRTRGALGFSQYMPNDKKLYSTDELFQRVCMALGGRVAESMTFNKVTTGAADDLQKVTKIVYAIIRQYGMNETIGNISFPAEAINELGKKPYSKKLANVIDQEARKYVAKAFQYTEKVLSENKGKLELLAKALVEREVLNYQDMVELLGPPPFGAKKQISHPFSFGEELVSDKPKRETGEANPSND